jgi:hypothetical protein
MSSDHFVSEILGRPEITRWVSVLSLKSVDGHHPDAIESLRTTHHRLLHSLSHFYNCDLITKQIPQIQTAIDPSSVSPFSRRIYHQVRYIDRKIAKLNRRHHASVIKLFNSIIEYLTSCSPTDDGMYACVTDRDALFRYAASHPRCSLLRNYADFRMSMVGNFRTVLVSEEEIRQELIQVVEIIGQTMDPRTSFFPQTRLQPTFERLMMSEKLNFGENFDFVQAFVADDPAVFLQEFFRFTAACIANLGINRNPTEATFILLLIRFVFDRVYDRNPFFQGPAQNIIGCISKVTMRELSPPNEFLPPFEEDGFVHDFFKNDPLFSVAVNELNRSMFQTNGLDILDCVEKAIRQIERAAFQYNNGETIVFPFEVTFALFLGVLIGSEIRNWEQIANFVEAYTPSTGMCPAFEFSRAKVLASLVQLQQMADDPSNT